MRNFTCKTSRTKLHVRDFAYETWLTRVRDGQGTRGNRSVRGDCSGGGRRARKTSRKRRGPGVVAESIVAGRHLHRAGRTRDGSGFLVFENAFFSLSRLPRNGAKCCRDAGNSKEKAFQKDFPSWVGKFYRSFVF